VSRVAGLEAEVLVSLGVLVLASGGVLAALLLRESDERSFELLARALAAEAMAASPLPASEGARWWRLPEPGQGGAADPASAGLPPELAETARRAVREGRAILEARGLAGPIDFAMPVPQGRGLAAARIAGPAALRLRAAPRAVAVGLLAADVLVFTAFGAFLLRRRLIAPLRALADAAQRMAEGDLGVRVQPEGPRECEELGRAFNEMTESLRRRTEELEKAVADLRSANRELRSARRGLLRAERLAAVGQLAAGVAHEVGNPMGALLAFLDLAERPDDVPEGTRRHLARARAEVERVRAILRQLLDFSRPPRGEALPVDLPELAREAVGLVRAEARNRGIRFSVQLEGSPPPAWGDPGAIRQILLNLLLNAAHAVREREPAEVRVRIGPAALHARTGDGPEAARARRHPDAVACEVEDDGPGVPPELRERIFDAFFTTRPPGEGTGLGLATAGRLAAEQGGELELLPGSGRGARFRLLLPAPPACPPVDSAPRRGKGAGELPRNPLRGANAPARQGVRPASGGSGDSSSKSTS